MTLAEILLAAKAAAELANLLTGLSAKLVIEGRDPTPEEVKDVKARQAVAEANWAATLPK